MATWLANCILVRHKCGCKLWLEGAPGTEIFHRYAVIAGQLWILEDTTTCPVCGAQIIPFLHKEWVEA